MTLAALPTLVDALAPLRLPDDLQLTPDQFAAVCQANPNAVLELDAGPLFPGLRIDLEEIWTV